MVQGGVGSPRSVWDPPPRLSLDADPSLHRFIGAMRLKPQTTARITFTAGLMSSQLHVAGVTGTVPSPDTSSPSRSPPGRLGACGATTPWGKQGGRSWVTW